MNKSDNFSFLDLDALKVAQEWEEKMIKFGSYRDHFFDAFSNQIDQLFEKPVSILEIGSGPGHLAERILKTNKVKNYTLFDLSDSMNHIASKRLKKYHSITDYKTGSFLDKECFDDLGKFDIVVCMQSIHEVRDKKLAVDIYKNVIKIIKPNGYFLVCDFVFGDPGMNNETMYMTVVEQKKALTESGFMYSKLILSHAGLTLYIARKIHTN